MRIAFAGTPQVALPTLDALVAAGHDVAAVITRPDAPAGRGKRLVASPVAQRAEELGIDVLKPAHPREPEFAAALAAMHVEAVPVVAYGALLPQSVLDLVPHGWINLHFSLLPRWRGAAPVQRAIMAGDERTGATTFRIVRELDAGPVYGSLEEPIEPSDTAGSLLARLADKGAALMVDTLRLVETAMEPAEQSDTGVTLAPKITVEDASIDWSLPAGDLRNHIHGCNPDPGAWTTFRGERFKISTAIAEPLLPPDDRPGTLRVTKKAVFVASGRGTLVLGEVQAQGKRPMDATAWARGVRIEPGERFT